MRSKGTVHSLTPKVRRSLHVESHRGGGAGVRLTDRWNGQPRSSPSCRYEPVSSRESGKSASVGPGKIFRAQRRTVIAGELLGQTAISWGVLGVDEKEAISKGLDGGDQGRVGRG